MSESGSGGVIEIGSHSQSNLIDVQHVGVTAKLQTPLKTLIQDMGSSTETDAECKVYGVPLSKAKYNKFSNDTQMDTTEDATSSDASKILYEMKAVRTTTTSASGMHRHRYHHAATRWNTAAAANTRKKSASGMRLPPAATPSKIEFQLYSKTPRPTRSWAKRKPAKRHDETDPGRAAKNATATEQSLFQRLRQSIESSVRPKTADKNALFDDWLGTPPAGAKRPTTSSAPHIGIYPFEHGCADYLRTTDCPPQIVSVVLAERATQYATRFWAEFFGTVHIGVAFVVTFLLQCYRFVLFSLVNTLLVGFLHMTSDYLIKPILTVLFNGFLQPPLIFVYNVLASLRDILEPVADTLNNFMKPVATVGRSMRLIHATYDNRKFVKEV